jgi:IS30 family transposase
MVLNTRSHRVEVRLRFWDGVRAGGSVAEAAALAGVSHTAAKGWFRDAGGVMPASREPGRARPRLTFAQREEIAALFAAGEKQAQIALVIGCHRSTVGRELKRNAKAAKYRPLRYLASVAQRQTD